MSKEFAMLSATRRLEKYLSRESFNLKRMEKNPKVPISLFQTKAEHYNELIDTLNELFGALSDSPASELFQRYESLSLNDSAHYAPDDGMDDDGFDDEAVSPAPVTDTSSTRPELDAKLADDDASEDAPAEPEQPEWQRDGYASYEDWLNDKEAARAETPTDLSVGVNVSLSKRRAEEALDEYKKTSEQDIASYVPENDKPVSVLPDERPTEDLNYLNHTVDNVRVDNDPTQIAAVQTAVERDAEGARKGTDIDVGSYLYESNEPVVPDLLGDEIRQLQGAAAFEPETEDDQPENADESNQEDVPSESEDSDVPEGGSFI